MISDQSLLLSTNVLNDSMCVYNIWLGISLFLENAGLFMHVYIWYGLVCTYVLWFLLQRDALLQYGEYAALLPKATEKVSICYDIK